MANGLNPLLSLQGKTNATNGLVVAVVAISGSPGPASALANKQCAVDASNALVVTFG